jgi:hypothetical protein
VRRIVHKAVVFCLCVCGCLFGVSFRFVSHLLDLVENVLGL